MSSVLDETSIRTSQPGLTDARKRFHVLGAATGKARSPKVISAVDKISGHSHVGFGTHFKMFCVVLCRRIAHHVTSVYTGD